VSPLVLLGVGLLGGLGALARAALTAGVGRSWTGAFPAGTFAVNMTGCFALGLLVGAAPSDDTLRLAGTGFLGAYTTFSTWMLEAHRLSEEDEGAASALTIVLSLALGLGLAALGRQLTM
jgi:CrcB protein